MSDVSEQVFNLEQLLLLERAGESTGLCRDMVESVQRQIDLAADADQASAADLACRVTDVAVWMMETGRWL